jgi:hypothetical protein
MGGVGSGDWLRESSKKTTDKPNKLDVRWLKRKGCLEPGHQGIVKWYSRDKEISSIGLTVFSDMLLLRYSYRSKGKEWQDANIRVGLTQTLCNYGGSRPWFLCPLCGKRVAVIYNRKMDFSCRHCCDLVYASQKENRIDRQYRKARKLRCQLKVSQDFAVPVLFKPKGMHQKTFDRLRWKSINVERDLWAKMEIRINSLFGKLEEIRDDLVSE